MTSHATPTDLLARAATHERQAEECFRAGLARAAADHTATAQNLRQLSMEATEAGR